MYLLEFKWLWVVDCYTIFKQNKKLIFKFRETCEPANRHKTDWKWPVFWAFDKNCFGHKIAKHSHCQAIRRCSRIEFYFSNENSNILKDQKYIIMKPNKAKIIHFIFISFIFDVLFLLQIKSRRFKMKKRLTRKRMFNWNNVCFQVNA